MEHKDIWLVLGLTVVLAVAVSLSTVSLSGNVVKKSSQVAAALPACVFISEHMGTSYNYPSLGSDTNAICSKFKSAKGSYIPVSYTLEVRDTYYESNDGTCSGRIITRTEATEEYPLWHIYNKNNPVQLYTDVTPGGGGVCNAGKSEMKDYSSEWRNIGVTCCTQ